MTGKYKYYVFFNVLQFEE